MPDDVDTDAREPDPHETQSLAVARARAEVADVAFCLFARHSRGGLELPEGFATMIAAQLARELSPTLERLAFRSFTFGVDRGQVLAAEEAAALDAGEVAAG